MTNATIDLIHLMDKEPVNRDSYIKTAYLGKPPRRLDSETEADLPDEPRMKAFREKTHEEVAKEEAEAGKENVK